MVDPVKRGVGKPKGSPRPPGSGRRKGTPNKATSEVKSLAQMWGSKVIDELARLALNAESDADRIAAAKELLNRGYCKAPNPIQLGGFNGGPLTMDMINSMSADELEQFCVKMAEVIVANTPKPTGGG